MANKFITHTPRNNPSQGAIPAIVCDMDHTLCHADNRHVYDYDKVDTDVPDWATIEIVHGLISSLGLDLIILTAREDIGNCRQKTSNWLLKHNLNPVDILMRPAKDFRHSNLVKKELIEKHVLPIYNVLMVFEDSKRCADTYKEMGLKVIMPEVNP